MPRTRRSSETTTPDVIVTARGQVPIHGGDVAPGTLRSIQRQLAPVFGEGWLI
jgi:hypothetical protein